MAGVGTNGKDVVIHSYIQIRFIHPRQIRENDKPFSRLVDIDRGRDITLPMPRSLSRRGWGRLLGSWRCHSFLGHHSSPSERCGLWSCVNQPAH
jgi:hypothetical protein